LTYVCMHLYIYKTKSCVVKKYYVFTIYMDIYTCSSIYIYKTCCSVICLFHTHWKLYSMCCQ